VYLSKRISRRFHIGDRQESTRVSYKEEKERKEDEMDAHVSNSNTGVYRFENNLQL